MALWTALLNGFTHSLQYLHDLTGSYGLAIIIITVIIRAVLWPLTQAQVNSMRRMQALQPEVARLQQKYKNDKERLNQETMRLWKEHHVNPAAGCLPMVVQLPILWAIYRVLEYFPYQGPHSFLWLASLSAADPYYVMPILGGLTTFWQTRISTVVTPGTSNQSQMMMTYLMPVFIAYIFWRLPAGVAVYWIISNIFSIAQQYVANRRHPGPGRPAPGGSKA